MPDMHFDCLTVPARRQAPTRAAEPHSIAELSEFILASSHDCIVVLDLDGTMRFVSQSGIDGMEIDDPASVIGQCWLRVWKGSHLVAARAALAAARAGGIGRFRGSCLTHKDMLKWWDVVISGLPGPDGNPARLVSVARDITAYVQAQDRMAVSEELLRLATEAAEIGTWGTDMRTGVLVRSERAQDMLKVTPGAPFTMADFYNRLHPQDRQRVMTAFAAATDPAQRAPYEVEYRTIGHADGQEKWIQAKGRATFDADGTCLRVSGTSIDITPRKAAEARLRSREVELCELNATLELRVEERTRQRDRAWNNSRDLLLVVDATGTIHAANAACTAILGWRPDEIVGMHYLELVHPDDHATTTLAFHAGAKGKLSPRENRYRHKVDGYRWISWVAAWEDGMIYANGRHITAYKEAAAELEATQEKLRQSQKMEAVGQLTGGLAHDFNNLLAGITGSLEMLQKRIGQGRLESVDRYIGGAQDAARRAAALTQRLLAFSRRQTLDPRPTDTNRLIDGMEDLIRRTVGPTIAINVVTAVRPWLALADQNQLENALLNLCINARDAMPDGGRLTIETANTWLDQAAAAERDLPAGQYISLRVSDNGTGMPPEVLARAFDPFFTTKPLGQGTGLGLSMIYGFARQSGGHVRISSDVGRGTTVSIYLPRHVGEEDRSEHPAAEATPAPTGCGDTVLIVDDEATVRLLLAEVLGDAGFATIQASDGAAALEVLHSDRRIDLLVTDVGLPNGMNGRQVADAGRSLRPGLNVLFITGYAEAAVIGNSQLEPGMQILTKPFRIDGLMAKVSQLLEKQLAVAA